MTADRSTDGFIKSLASRFPSASAADWWNEQRTEEMASEGIVIVGAGIAGLATALGLHRKGIRSLVLESSSTLRASGFAFTTWNNAFRALDALGVGDKMRESHTLIERLTAGSVSSDAAAAKLGLNFTGKAMTQEIRCVRRNTLLETLASELPEGTIRYSSKIVAMDEDENGHIKVLHLADGATIRAKVVIGCDGINSVVAKWLGLKKVSDSGRVATRGLADFPDGHGFPADFLQLFGMGIRFGLTPCNDRSIYWFFTWSPAEQGVGTQTDVSAAEIREFVTAKLRQSNVPFRVVDVIEQSEITDVAMSPLRYRSPFSLVTAAISRGNVCVAGDALHPMTPDLGQGGCTALEDGVVLAHCLSRADLDDRASVTAALNNYAERRRWRSIWVVAMAYLLGFVNQSQNPILAFLRDQFLSGMLQRVLLSFGNNDCGTL